MPTIDKAYCHQTDSVLTIYQVRDMHFDEDDDFDGNQATFECSVELRGVNHKAVEFKTTPHFRVRKNHQHDEECDYLKPQQDRDKKATGTGEEQAYKDTNYPTELLLERQKAPRGTGKPKKPQSPREPATWHETVR